MEAAVHLFFHPYVGMSLGALALVAGALLLGWFFPFGDG